MSSIFNLGTWMLCTADALTRKPSGLIALPASLGVLVVRTTASRKVLKSVAEDERFCDKLPPN
jgi:hypothetical protein